MTELVRLPDANNVLALSDSDLLATLAAGLTLVADRLAYLATVWQEAERRAIDKPELRAKLSGLKIGLAKNLPLIAAGQLAAEAVVAFAGRAMVLRSLIGVPLDRQRQLAAGDPIAVIDPADPRAVNSISLGALPAASLGLVFADGEIREPAAQRLALRHRRQRAKPTEGERKFQPRYDPESGMIHVGPRAAIALADLIRTVATSAGADRPPADIPSEYDVVRVRLTHDEFKRYSEICKKAGLPDWEMARKAMRAWGLI